ncbi:hypothetical protein L7F22_067040 [Adiantum nelumboides]|nr:hypothetical protein [Adiantum nelumboides]
MGSKAWAANLAKMEDKLNGNVKENKKIVDTSMNAILIQLSKMEKDMETWQKEKEKWEKDRTKWEEEKMAMQAQMETMKGEMILLRERSCREDGEILKGEKEAMKEELTKALAETIEVKTKAMVESIEGKMEATKDGWVEVVRKNLHKEVKEDKHIDEHQIIHTTIKDGWVEVVRKNLHKEVKEDKHIDEHQIIYTFVRLEFIQSYKFKFVFKRDKKKLINNNNTIN